DRLDVAERLASGYSKDQAGVHQTISIWQALWWDVHLAQIGCPDLIANVDRREAIESFARRVPEENVVAYLGNLAEASQRLAQNVNPRLALEALLLTSPALK
ncbi:MAG TPA: DNA polymerase III subunit delta' C-terminal domain-containing protein, partial [Chloroflexota bacterium]|nr:DNA polymerase III subunit delta' C-terminal domain-containing protein [Chloroflexota bacterium]